MSGWFAASPVLDPPIYAALAQELREVADAVRQWEDDGGPAR